MVHFISILGTNLYEPVVYTEKTDGPLDDARENEYVQLAMLEQFRNTIGLDKITIFLTEKARTLNWADRAYTEMEAERVSGWVSDKKNEVIAGKQKIGMETQLNNAFQEWSGQIETVDIANPMTEEQIWQIFGQIYDSIGENEEIIFDITHSFRSIPMLAITIINYARVMKNCKLGGIYYGAFEAGKSRDGKKVVPIVNLTVYNEILEWTNAADAFINYGIVRPMQSLYKEKNKAMTGAERQDRNWQKTKTLIDRMENLYKGLATGRGSSSTTNPKCSIKEAYHKLQDEKKEMEEANVKEQKPMYYLLAKAGESFEQNWEGKDAEELKDYQIGCGVIKWSIDNTMTQQGYTALEETIKTFLCHKFCLEGNTQIGRDNLVGFLINTIAYTRGIENRDKTERKAFIEQNNEQFRLQYESWNQAVQQRADIIIEEIPLDMVKISGNAKDKRNDINHFGFRKNCNPSDKLVSELKKYYEKFCQCMAEWGEEPLDLPMLTEKDMAKKGEEG